MVLFEEVGGDPTKISFATRKTRSLCAHVTEMHPPQVNSGAYLEMTVGRQKLGPMVHLTCPGSDQIINEIKFASFGTPQGTCGSYSHGKCTSNDTISVVQQVKFSLQMFAWFNLCHLLDILLAYNAQIDFST
jgi:hypothetical protein